ncbi:hypothetical protein AB0E69_15060 [Kribbella sp. NPDC026611]|uniref:hypothetical protein n=1 Tax=Kribbella sp. NPDC026611 TaxID=3154911 RepID=UPI0033F6D4A1
MQTVPAPIVSWETVVRMSDPTHEPSRERLRTLKRARTAYDGIRVTHRAHGRANGSATYYSAVTALAAAVKQTGDEDTAQQLSDSGSKIEARFKEPLRLFLSVSSMDQLEVAPFYADLIKETWKALDVVWPKLDGSLIAGQVKETRNDLTHILVDYWDEPARVDLPAGLLAKLNVHTGDWVWIIRRLVQSAAVLTVLPAVSARIAGDDDKLGREYLESGPGAPISRAEADFFEALSDDEIPTARVLRLAG